MRLSQIFQPHESGLIMLEFVRQGNLMVENFRNSVFSKWKISDMEQIFRLKFSVVIFLHNRIAHFPA